MSKGTANEILQLLIRKATAVWEGKGENFTAEDAYRLCKRFVEEYEKLDDQKMS